MTKKIMPKKLIIAMIIPFFILAAYPSIRLLAETGNQPQGAESANAKAISRKDALLSSGLAVKASNGSVNLKDPEEMIEKRTPNSKTWLVGYTKDNREIRRSRFFTSPKNYYDPLTSRYEDIDTRLIDNDTEDGWQMDKAPYQARIKKNVNNSKLATFKNKDQEIYLSVADTKGLSKDLIGKKTQGDQANSGRQVEFKNALGANIDLAFRLGDNSLSNETVINDLQALGDLTDKDSYRFAFKLSANKKIGIKIDGRYLNQEKSIISEKIAEIMDENGISSYIWPSEAIDSSANPASKRMPVKIEYKLNDDGSVTLIKIIPAKWLKQASYPVKSYIKISYLSGLGDGSIQNAPNNDWNTTHDSLSGTAVFNSFTEQETAVSGWNNSLSKYTIIRSFFPFDTSPIPDGAEIGTSTFNFFVSAGGNQDSDGDNFLSMVQTTQASTDSLSLDDYGSCGTTQAPVEGSNRISLDSLGAGFFSYNNYIRFTLNSAGAGWINKAGWTKLGIREGHDILDHAINQADPYIYDYVAGYYAEQAGTGNQPYLEIYMTDTPSLPTGLTTEGGINPEKVTDGYPEFNAIPAGAKDPADMAGSYRIQVSLENSLWEGLVWDSGRINMPATPAGSRSAVISFGQKSPLAFDGTRYYWRIKFWNVDGTEGVWSDGTDNFTMASKVQVIFP